MWDITKDMLKTYLHEYNDDLQHGSKDNFDIDYVEHDDYWLIDCHVLSSNIKYSMVVTATQITSWIWYTITQN